MVMSVMSGMLLMTIMDIKRQHFSPIFSMFSSLFMQNIQYPSIEISIISILALRYHS